jgi:hypothetical protein
VATQALLVLALTATDPSARPSAAELLQMDVVRLHAPAAWSGAGVVSPTVASPSPSASSLSTASLPSGGGGIRTGSGGDAPVDALVAAKDREIEALRRQVRDQALLLELLQAE